MKGLIKIFVKARRIISLILLSISLIALFFFPEAVLAKIFFVTVLAIYVLTTPGPFFQKSAGKRAALRKAGYQKR
ncbi:hypothetical protein FC19_GL002212 [Liquorilactobacillus aquaticus DSM 21051]|uniref:Uncharacterized protein n=1 Tax=Liquorilactobacillus aquaticus DSM 21051 TaxID=1423725 RepID=A0A0R2CTP2_9LACO|nr:hypothetical protein [Liquorilactobacillus aquaticus]KRM95118.1 hypothetical protein FC19_GL002212 [Liquorilactobacillus aquaticus DSM 21051]